MISDVAAELFVAEFARLDDLDVATGFPFEVVADGAEVSLRNLSIRPDAVEVYREDLVVLDCGVDFGLYL